MCQSFFKKLIVLTMQTKLIQEGEKATPPPFVSGRIKIGTGNPLYFDRIDIHLDIVNSYDSKAELKPLKENVGTPFPS